MPTEMHDDDCGGTAVIAWQRGYCSVDCEIHSWMVVVVVVAEIVAPEWRRVMLVSPLVVAL